MNILRSFIATLSIMVLVAAAPRSAAGAGQDQAASVGQQAKVRVLLITGGHDFEKEPFYKVFQNNDQITFKAVAHPNAHELLKADAAKEYDVIVLYDMWQKISDEAKANLVERLKDGKGLVALHHCIASYQDWSEYTKIIGGKYYLERHVENGVEKPGSTYKHGVTFPVHVLDPNHPVTRGVQDFEIHDETYGQFAVNPQAKPLLTTTEPTSGKTIAWTLNYQNARVVYLELGHDHFAYENPNYQRLLAQAIRFTAPNGLK